MRLRGGPSDPCCRGKYNAAKESTAAGSGTVLTSFPNTRIAKCQQFKEKYKNMEVESYGSAAEKNSQWTACFMHPRPQNALRRERCGHFEGLAPTSSVRFTITGPIRW